MIPQCVKGIRRISEPEMFYGRAGQLPLSDIFPRCLSLSRFEKHASEEFRRFEIHCKNPCSRRPRLVKIVPVVGERYSAAVCEKLERRNVIEILRAHYEGDDISSGSAAEAVKRLTLSEHGE